MEAAKIVRPICPAGAWKAGNLQHPAVVYVLTGFKQDLGFRVFSFERVGMEPRPISTVRADLGLARKHGILMQELPLQCRRVLEHAGDDGAARSLTYSEEAMLACVGAGQAQRELAARKKLWKPRAEGEAPADSLGHSRR